MHNTSDRNIEDVVNDDNDGVSILINNKRKRPRHLIVHAIINIHMVRGVVA